jgi:hypothetical protein
MNHYINPIATGREWSGVIIIFDLQGEWAPV